jgi:hypothetical protein
MGLQICHEDLQELQIPCSVYGNLCAFFHVAWYLGQSFFICGRERYHQGDSVVQKIHTFVVEIFMQKFSTLFRPTLAIIGRDGEMLVSSCRGMCFDATLNR